MMVVTITGKEEICGALPTEEASHVGLLNILQFKLLHDICSIS
jgi:hypothetical protein